MAARIIPQRANLRDVESALVVVPFVEQSGEIRKGRSPDWHLDGDVREEE